MRLLCLISRVLHYNITQNTQANRSVNKNQNQHISLNQFIQAQMFRSISAERNSFKIDSSFNKHRTPVFAKEQRRIPLDSFANKSFRDAFQDKLIKANDPHSIPDCSQCGSVQAFYYAPTKSKYYCATCGMDQMPQGTQLQQIKGKYYNEQPWHQYKMNRDYSPKRKQHQWEKPFRMPDYGNLEAKHYQRYDFQDIFAGMGKYESRLVSWLQQRKSHSKDVKQVFKSAKGLLKQHYKKLGELIKQCEQADEKALSQLQKRQDEIFKYNKKTIEEQLQTLKQFNIELENNAKIIRKNIYDLKYNQFMDHLRKNIREVGNWIKQDLSQKLHEVFLNKRSTKMYKPQRYRVINESIYQTPIVFDEKTKKPLLYTFVCS